MSIELSRRVKALEAESEQVKELRTRLAEVERQIAEFHAREPEAMTLQEAKRPGRPRKNGNIPARESDRAV